MKYKLLLVLLFLFPVCVYADQTIYVSSDEDIINTIDNIFSERSRDLYKLQFRYNNNINLDDVNSYFKDNYMTDMDKNMYKYDEYGIYEPIRNPIEKKDNYIELDTRIIKLTKDEEKEANIFSDDLVNKINSMNDYEKILYIYDYLNNINVNGYNSSIYDTLINKYTTKKGLSTTFAYLMDKLNIDNYIVEILNNIDFDNDNYVYNIVKINNYYYKIDFISKEFLTKVDRIDLYYQNLKYSDKDYKDNILIVENKANKNREKDNNNYMEYILLVLILAVVFSIVFIFTRH